MEKDELMKKLESIKDKLIRTEQTHDDRIYLVCESQNSFAVNKYLFEDLHLRFVIATGIDSDHYFEILYHYSDDQCGTVVTIKSQIKDKKNPCVESISPFLPAAEWIEREIHDILGIEFKNHPNMRRLVLADDWPEGVYPYRKEVKS